MDHSLLVILSSLHSLLKIFSSLYFWTPGFCFYFIRRFFCSLFLFLLHHRTLDSMDSINLPLLHLYSFPSDLIQSHRFNLHCRCLELPNSYLSSGMFEFQIHVSNYLFDLYTWISNRHLKWACQNPVPDFFLPETPTAFSSEWYYHSSFHKVPS